MFSRSKAVIVLSPWWERMVSDTLRDARIRTVVIPNSCPKIQQETAPNDGTSERYILYAGTIVSRKGYSDLINAFSRISATHLEWKLILLGNGELQHAQSIANNLGIGSRIELPGWVSGADKECYFRKAGIFCLPSYAEGFPMAVLDAIAYSLPIITTPVGGILDYLSDGISASIVPAGDVSKLAAALSELMSNSELRHNYAQTAHQLSLTTFSVTRACESLDAIYSQTIAY